MTQLCLHKPFTYQDIFELYIPMDKTLGVKKADALGHI